jgi:hypothetical protein
VRGACLKCGTDIPPDDAYCDNCTCPQCQAVKLPDEPLCDHCQVMQDEEIAVDFIVLFSFSFFIFITGRENAQHTGYSYNL